MSEFSQNAKPAFNAAAEPAPAYDLQRLIELAFHSIMDQDWFIAHPLVQITGDEEDGFELLLSTARSYDRNEEECLFNFETAIQGGVNTLAENCPVQFDAKKRSVSTPDLEVLIGLLSELTSYAHEPAISVTDLLEAQDKGDSIPLLQLH